ncbi:GSU3529 family protein [Geoalkalibacter halelectricus]|uniref:GSU3529 family protein n=1 Tax=Geoalkalibacter halelectricus TaxID=2847045 RepID=UPI003D252DEA
MNPIFVELEQATTDQFENGELPKWLADPVMNVARNPALYEGKEYLVEILLDQIREYDVYAEAGCCKWAYDHEDIARTLRWLEEKR